MKTIEALELNEGSSVEWMGYTIKRKRDFHPKYDKGKIGYVVTKGGVNVMPAATWFNTVEDAEKGIAALTIARKIDAENEGETFWALMKLAGFLK